jgi:hypothetical protein
VIRGRLPFPGRPSAPTRLPALKNIFVGCTKVACSIGTAAGSCGIADIVAIAGKDGGPAGNTHSAASMLAMPSSLA